MQGVPIDPTPKDFWEHFSKVSAPDHQVAGNEQVAGNDQVAGNEPHRQLWETSSTPCWGWRASFATERAGMLSFLMIKLFSCWLCKILLWLNWLARGKAGILVSPENGHAFKKCRRWKAWKLVFQRFWMNNLSQNLQLSIFHPLFGRPGFYLGRILWQFPTMIGPAMGGVFADEALQLFSCCAKLTRRKLTKSKSTHRACTTRNGFTLQTENMFLHEV